MSASLETFIAASHYTAPVDLKKLAFIYDAIVEHARSTGRDPAALEILEVACGVGGITLPLATFGGNVRAFDIDADDLVTLRERAGEKGLHNILATREDALAFLDGRLYDVVVASEVFEHVHEPERLALKCAEHLAPGGILIVTTPNGYGPWETVNSIRLIPRRWNWLRRLAGKPPHDGAGREHEQRYTRERLVSLFRGHGLVASHAANSDFVLTLWPSLRNGQSSGRIDCRLADLVPHWMASGWYVVLRKGNQ